MEYPISGNIEALPFFLIDPATGLPMSVIGTIHLTNLLYVAKNGNDLNTGDISAPFLTIGAAITAASSGTTINIAPGTYAENLTLKAGVSLQGQQARSVFITGNVTAGFIGTVYLNSCDLQASSGVVLTFSGANATNLRLDDCHIDSLSGASHCIDHTNTNAASKLTIDNAAINVAVSSGGAKSFNSAATSAGSIIWEDVSARILDTKTNVALNVIGALTFSHLLDDVHGTINVANTATYTGVNLTIDCGASAMLATTSSGASSLANIVCLSTANPVVTGAGVFAYGPIGYASTGSGLATTLNGGAGASPVSTSPLQIHSATVSPTPFDGCLEYDGTNLFFTVGAVRKTVTLV